MHSTSPSPKHPALLHLVTLLIGLFHLFTFVDAALYVVDPRDRTVCKGGQPCTVTWLDDGRAPLLSAIGVSTVGLYTGSRKIVQTLPPIDVSQTLSFTFTPNPAAGPNSGAYYISFTSTESFNGTVPYSFYSPWFRCVHSHHLTIPLKLTLYRMSLAPLPTHHPRFCPILSIDPSPLSLSYPSHPSHHNPPTPPSHPITLLSVTPSLEGMTGSFDTPLSSLTRTRPIPTSLTQNSQPTSSRLSTITVGTLSTAITDDGITISLPTPTTTRSSSSPTATSPSGSSSTVTGSSTDSASAGSASTTALGNAALGSRVGELGAYVSLGLVLVSAASFAL
ncbi:hypothetical protein FA13DRAFT_1157750 [Coprinellus micaceus]|uniref:Yeast cell wall synthesis Kre9/Knh1-like N-terminal domain-containing protein n=1 Tax=Coprinellus micaceus TaxID=71717 RepID=A0A4Y7SUD9_COPMI|nr:hypothetical protein FA13DRAFT_1157750 [Coprinellus micaceus]